MSSTSEAATATPPPPPPPPPPQQQQPPPEQGFSAAPPSIGKLSFDDISKYFSLPIAEAATILGVCTSVLKRICRENGIVRWPYRKFLAGKTVEDIKKDAAREKNKELAELSKLAKQRVDVPKIVTSPSVGLSSNFGTQVQNRTAGTAQDMSRLQRGVSMPGNVLQPHGTKFPQHGWQAQSNPTRSIPTYLDDFKYGFPANGLSSDSTKWWGSSSLEGGTLSGKTATEEVKQQSCNLENESSSCIMIDDQNDSATRMQPSTSLLSLRERAAECGCESLKGGISNFCKSYKMGKRQKLVLIQIFRSSLPDQWKASFS